MLFATALRTVPSTLTVTYSSLGMGMAVHRALIHVVVSNRRIIYSARDLVSSVVAEESTSLALINVFCPSTFFATRYPLNAALYAVAASVIEMYSGVGFVVIWSSSVT